MAGKNRKAKQAKKGNQESTKPKATSVAESKPESALDSKDRQENNNDACPAEDDYEDEIEENEWCDHMDDSDVPAIQRLMRTAFPCKTCQQKAHFSCIHSDCIDNPESSCCENIKHIFPHIMMNDHPAILHHKYGVVLCTQCNVQSSFRHFLSNYGISTDVKPNEPVASRGSGLQGTSGFPNFGTTCYMNAIFQFLGHCPPFADFFCSFEPPMGWGKFPDRVGSITCQLAIDLRLMWHEFRLPYINPLRLVQLIRLEMPGFETFQQQDASELLRALLEIIDRELKKMVIDHQLVLPYENNQTFPTIPTIITQLFQGTLQNKIECHSCGFQSRTYENFSDLCLPIVSEQEELDFLNFGIDSGDSPKPDPEIPDEENGTSIDPGFLVHRAVKKKTSLAACLDNFFQSTTLQGDNQYSCAKCRALVDATKSSKATNLPEVLLIQLKRFRHTVHGTRKVVKTVEFPVRSMNFGRYTTSGKDEYYDLIGFVVHEGHSLDYGHYITYSKHPQDASWYKFDDLVTTRCSETRVARKHPYILMYRKRAKDTRTERVEIPQFPKVPYNSVRSSHKMERRGDAWELIQSVLENEEIENQSDVEDKEEWLEKQKKRIMENPGEIPAGGTEEAYQVFESMLNDLMESTEESNKKSRKNAKAMSMDDTIAAKNNMIQSMECWLKATAKKAFIERELNSQGRVGNN